MMHASMAMERGVLPGRAHQFGDASPEYAAYLRKI